MMPGVTSDLEARRIALIHKRLAAAQTTDRLARREWCVACPLWLVPYLLVFLFFAAAVNPRLTCRMGCAAIRVLP